jgi:uncharacterized protein YcfJ
MHIILFQIKVTGKENCCVSVVTMKRKEPDIDPDSMIGQAVAAMVGAVIGLSVLDEVLKHMRLARKFKEEGYKLFSCRM